MALGKKGYSVQGCMYLFARHKGIGLLVNPM